MQYAVTSIHMLHNLHHIGIMGRKYISYVHRSTSDCNSLMRLFQKPKQSGVCMIETGPLNLASGAGNVGKI